jgi:hypothetical protein
MTVSAKQLKNDLNDIKGAIAGAIENAEVKRAFGELIEWNHGLVDAHDAKITAMTKHLADLTTTIEMLEADEAEEGISFESGTVLIAGYEQAKMVNAAVLAFLEGPGNTLDQVTTKRLSDLIAASNMAITTAENLIEELVDVPDDEEVEDGVADEDVEGEDEIADEGEGEE